MKKRLLLMLIAVVCLSPSIVFAEGSYMGNAYTASWQTDPDTGQKIAVKGGPSSIGAFQRAPAQTISSSANVAGMQYCPFAAARDVKSKELDQETKKLTGSSGDVAGNAIN
jgi:hypothetical protein